MLKKLFGNERRALPLLCLFLCILGEALFTGYFTKLTGVLAGVVLVYLFSTHDLRALRSPFVWPLFGYVVFAAFTAIWAMSGKFFLREYLKVFIGAAICLWLLLKPRFDAAFLRRVMLTLAGTTAIYAFLSVEAATTGISKAILEVFGIATENMLFQNTIRLYGIFSNPNVEASIFALGVLVSVALLGQAESKRERVICASTLAINAFPLLLGFSMGALACFAVSVFVYLVFAGRARGAAFVHMLEGAVPTLVCALVSYPMFNRGALGKLPLLFLLLDAALAAALELRVAPRVIAALESRQKLLFGSLLGLAALLAVYIALALSLHGPFTFSSAVLSRVMYLSPGAHTMVVNADADVVVTISSRNRSQTMTGEFDLLYGGKEAEFSFVVPEDSEMCSFTFAGPEGLTMYSAVVDGATAIPLKYRLLPDFIARRIQGIRTNTNFIQRVIFMEDGVKLWRLSPVVGNGLGSFENGVLRVQEFPYRTRYVHSHYVQTLLETGVIGFALWIATLAAMVAALWRQRKAADSPYRWSYAALWAALTMLLLQTAVDLSLSFVIYILYAYTLFGLILRTCVVEPEAAKTAAEEAAQPKKRKKAAVTREEFTLGRTVLLLLPAVFTITLCANAFSQSLLAKSVSSYDQFFSRANLAVKLDAYEHNDAKVSYVVAAMQIWSDVSSAVRAQADAYAEELARVQSNSIPATLTNFYLNTQRYEKAIDAAKLCAVYSAGDQDTWNGIVNMFRQAFLDGFFSPLLVDGEPLVRGLLEYYSLLEAYNATAIVPVELGADNQAFFDKIERLVPYPDDPEAVAEILFS